MNTPNIFSYATSELSQDAFLLWLLDWANHKYAVENPELNKAAKNFVCMLLERPGLDVTTVTCYKQEKHIDVFAVVNDQYAIIIEDKTDTSEHHNQLKRYSDWVKNEYNDLELHCIYYKTGNESLYKLHRLASKYNDEFHEEFFKVVSRKEVIDTLSRYNVPNSLFNDYISHIKGLEDMTSSYIHLPLDKWSWRSWQGFYLDLERRLGEGDWGYVANPTGGFWGFWWNWIKVPSDTSIELYLQFEQKRLCIKANITGNSRPSESWTKTIVAQLREAGLDVDPPQKRKTGKSMTIAVLHNALLFDGGRIDMDLVVNVLNHLKQSLHLAVEAI